MEPVRIASNKTRVLIKAALQTIVVLLLHASVVGVLGLIMLPLFVVSLMMLLYSVPQWFRAWYTPALVADKNGITDATGAVPGGLVHWHEIAGIETIETLGENLLLIRLHDPRTYLSRLPDAPRLLLTSGANTYGTPCVVSADDIAVPVGEAKQLLLAARARFAGAGDYAPSREATRFGVAPESGRERLPVATAPTAHWWTAVPPEERTAKPLQMLGRSDDR